MPTTTGITRTLLFLTLLAPLLLVHLGTPAPAVAQSAPGSATLTGRVTDDWTGQPMIDALVVARMDGREVARALSSPDGGYRLSVPPGTVVLEAERMGWYSTGENRVTVAAGETRTLDLTLEPDALRGEAIIVTPTRGLRPAGTPDLSVASVVDRDEVRRRAAVGLADVAASQPGVDVAETGRGSRTITTRGFSNVFTGAALVLVDHRDAALPSLRADFTHFLPTTLQDVEKVEVVLGPTTAVYGPNAANGVIHVLTPSSLGAPTTSFSVAAGNGSLFEGSFRTTQRLASRLGLRVSGRWSQSEEFPYEDPVEETIRIEIETDPDGYAQKLRDRGVPEGEIQPRMARTAIRDPDLERWSLDGRLDAELPTGDTLVVQGGTSDNTGIELTPLGAGQAGGWRYGYLQTRLHGGPLFAQLYLNSSTAGDTYLLRDGAPLVDESRVIGAQVRHGFELSGGRHDLTYGADWLLTTPRTGGTIHGQFEDDDEIEEVGGYLQGRFGLGDRVNLLATGRGDHSTMLDDLVFSPRVGLTWEAAEGRRFRLSLSRGFSTPTPTNSFLDLAGGRASGDLGALGYFTRAQGTGRDGIRFRQDDGSWIMRSPFTPTSAGGPSTLRSADARHLWLGGVELLLAEGAIDAQTAAFLRSLDPNGSVGVQALDPVTGATAGLGEANIADVEPLRETTTTTLEAGVQNLIADRVLVQAGLWHTWRENFTSPLLPRTPLLFLDATELAAFLAASGLPAQQAEGLAAGLGPVPLGVVSSEDIQGQGAEVVASYLNYGSLSYWGADLGVSAELDHRWRLDGALSWVSRDHFAVDGRRVALNAPELKGNVGLGFTDLPVPVSGETRLRFHSGFPVSSGDYSATRCLGDEGPVVEDCVDSAALVDLTLGYPLPVQGASVRLQARNVFDTPYRSFVGSPTTGRIVSLRLDWSVR